MSGFNIVWVGCAITGLVALSYVVVPKGQHQTWAITYLSQLHPLIAPKRAPGEH
ncbi:12144_t:CDS:2 [Funneliformis caledonium]|uniref:12144_t:CDS:1 n=2 Tax=Funneliformis TaxID=1117308 RepID=A0A9N8V535_9GLOM|nr:12144_t:CDS:2 [Funneliformis caledonium]CAG8452035.1 5282_t:CDS:2 [Funneliformis mosseae]